MRDGLPCDLLSQLVSRRFAVERRSDEGLASLRHAVDDYGDDLARVARNSTDWSFAPDTLVTTSEGLVPISEIALGDTVLAYNEMIEEVGEYPVTGITAHLDDNLLYLTVENASGAETITTTTDHPFYTAEGEWIEASP